MTEWKRGAPMACAFIEQYDEAFRMATAGRFAESEELYRRIDCGTVPPDLHALIENDLGVLAVIKGEMATARDRFERSLVVYGECAVARQNLAFLDSHA